MAKFRFQCCECGCTEYGDIEEFGEDEYGEYTDYLCAECGATTRYSDEE